MCSGVMCSSCENNPNDVHKKDEVEARSQFLSNKEFFVKEFVDNLLNRGSVRACDESVKSFANKLPPYYDEHMFKRGQENFHKNMFGMFLGNFLGLLSLLSIKSSLAILILTKMSSTDFTAYKRYVATIFHMMIWYDSEFKPGSKLWESIENVKSKHNSASKKAVNILKYRINQKDMALAQFGFMGLVLARSEFLGIYDTSEEDMKCFVHVWRVIGYTLGIEDEFNICRESVEETKAICNEIAIRVMKPEVKRKDKEYRQMCSYLVNGLWVVNPFLNLNTFMFYLEMTLNNSRFSISNENQDCKQLSKGEKFRVHIILFVIGLMRVSVVRIFLNYLQIHALWIAQTSPYLAYYKFGKSNSHVKVLGSH